MFDSLDEQMKHDDAVGTTKNEKLIKYSAIAITSVFVFGALYFGLMLLEG